VDADVMVILAEQDAVLDAGRSAVFLVLDVVDAAASGALVAAAGPGALLIAEDDGAPDRLGDVVGVADVDGDALAVDRRGALGGEVPGDPPGVIQGGVDLEVSLALPAVIVIGVVIRVGAAGAPGLVGGLGDDPQVIEVRAGRGGVQQDLVGLLAQFSGREAPGPGGDLPGPGPGQRPGAGGVVQQRVLPSRRTCRTAALASLRLSWVLAASQRQPALVAAFLGQTGLTLESQPP